MEKLRFGMVGGGNGAFIGDVHRRGAEFDNLARLVAGCFTRNAAANAESAALWGVDDPSRVYPSWQAMAEAEGKREDKIDFVIIATPNDTHYPIAKAFMEQGIHIMSDKPLTLTLEESEELEAMAGRLGLLFGVTYTYLGYAMVRQAREMVAAGEIGRVTQVHGEYPQEWLAVSLVSEDSEQAVWRLDPAKSGASGTTADIGTHTEALMHFVSGLAPEAVLARLDVIPGKLSLETNVMAMLRYEGNVPGSLWASQVAVGHETDIAVRVFGERGSVEWNHLRPGELRVTRVNQPPQIYTAGRDALHPAARAMCRLPSGHPEGFYESFGNLYRGFCLHLLAKKDRADAGSFLYPTVQDGVRGMRFIHACLESDKRGNVWVSL